MAHWFDRGLPTFLFEGHEKYLHLAAQKCIHIL